MISPKYHDLLTATNTGVLVTLNPDGSPHAAPVWFLFDGEAVIVSTVAERQKHRNVVRDPRVSFTVIDPHNVMRYLEIRGTVEVAPEPTYAVRDAVAQKHGYPDGAAFDRPDTRRVALTIRPTKVVEH